MSLMFIAPRSYSIPVLNNDYDPYWDNVVLLMHMDGADNSTAFIDETGKSLAVRATGAGSLPKHSTADYKFSTASGLFNSGAWPNGACIETYNDGTFDFGTGIDFTMEAWVKIAANAVSRTIVSTFAWQTGYRGGWQFVVGPSLIRIYAGVDVSATVVFPTNVWTHVAATRQGSIIRLFINGSLVKEDSTTVLNMSRPTTHATNVRIGSIISDSGNLESGFVGQIDDLRITSGVARYTADFSVPTAAFPDARGLDYYWDNTVLAMNCDDLTDLRGKTVTNYGLTVNTTDKVTGSGSLTSLATTYARIPYSSDFSFEADFTIEAWVYPTQTTVPNDDGWGRQCILSCGKAYSSSMWHLEWSGYAAASKFSVRWVNGSATESVGVTSTNTYALNTWHHVAACRKGTTVYLFVNGQLAGSVVSAQPFTITGSGQTFNIGRTDYGSITRDFVGHVDGVRITKGISRYTSGFLPSQDSFALPLIDPYWTQVVLAMRMNGDDQSQVFVDEKGHTFTLGGDPVLSTAVKRFGSASCHLDGDDRLLLDGSSDFAFGSSDFTIEAFIYRAAAGSGYQTIYDSRPLGTNVYAGITFGVDVAAGTLYLYSGGVMRITGGSPVTLNTWHHVAISRAAGVTRVFLNGVQQGSNWSDSTVYLNGANRPAIGVDSNNGATYHFTGYLDDVRVTKGIARYVSTFVTPTRELLLGS